MHVCTRVCERTGEAAKFGLEIRNVYVLSVIYIDMVDRSFAVLANYVCDAGSDVGFDIWSIVCSVASSSN